MLSEQRILELLSEHTTFDRQGGEEDVCMSTWGHEVKTYRFLDFAHAIEAEVRAECEQREKDIYATLPKSIMESIPDEEFEFGDPFKAAIALMVEQVSTKSYEVLNLAYQKSQYENRQLRKQITGESDASNTGLECQADASPVARPLDELIRVSEAAGLYELDQSTGVEVQGNGSPFTSNCSTEQAPSNPWAGIASECTVKSWNGQEQAPSLDHKHYVSMAFYGVSTIDDLIAAQEQHIIKLQRKLRGEDNCFENTSGRPNRVREG